VRGRDVEEKETAVVFNAGAWSILGEAAAVRRSVTRNVTLDAIKCNGQPMTPAEIASATGETSNKVRQILFRMAKAGEVYKIQGRYWVDPVYPSNERNA
jgi:hypothetical protein